MFAKLLTRKKLVGAQQTIHKKLFAASAHIPATTAKRAMNMKTISLHAAKKQSSMAGFTTTLTDLHTNSTEKLAIAHRALAQEPLFSIDFTWVLKLR
jgi:hypothetical protein